MNLYVCIFLGCGLAILYKYLQNRKAKKAQQELQNKLQDMAQQNVTKNQTNVEENIVIENKDDSQK